MSRHSQTGPRHRAWGVPLLLVSLLLLFWADLAVAQDARLQRVRSGSQAARTARQNSDSADRVKNIQWVQGEAHLDARGELTVDGTRILLSLGTGVYPIPSAGHVVAEDLDHQRVVIVGELTRAGLEASLVLVRPPASPTQSIVPPHPHLDIIPSESDPRVGVYPPDSPR